ncbi:MAG TPA: ATP-binding cassette domain-containing protein [Nitrolancea sp.]|nr:ATP-binding cassette domain-containing protein [Nitrolancea sp.]
MSEPHEGKPVLNVQGLELRYGRGCPFCVAATGPEAAANRCPHCGTIVACAEVDFSLYEEEVLGVVGESGSGKTTLLRCLNFDLAPTAGAAYLADFEGGQANIWDANPQRKRYIRNHLMGMVYQNPRDGLDLDVTAGGNIAERLIMANQRHVGHIRARSSYLLDRTEVPVDRMDEPPRTFSGGMQQRVQIAKALANGPRLLLLDEVTTGLDVSVQARVLDLLRSLQRELGISMIVVSHDLGVVRLLTHRTAVMKNGRIVETGLTDQILEDPQHPYTQLLVNSLL